MVLKITKPSHSPLKEKVSPNDSGGSGDSVESELDRGSWSKAEFILSLVGYAVGLSNLWRFPYLCMQNGGGAFLIPYFFFLVVCGIPLFFLEVSMGQFASLGVLTIWKVSPLFKGLGYGMVIVSGIVCIYYNLIITWVLYYLFSSFTWTLPWSDCNNEWNTHLCSKRGVNVSEIINSTMATTPVITTTTGVNLSEAIKPRSPAEEFWQFKVLDVSSGIHELGGMRWELLGCLVAAWVIVFLCLIKGIKTSGKVVFVTATVPYIFLTILLIRGLLLDGAMDGIKYYITPDFSRIGTFKVWSDACLQIFYSLGPAWGALYTYSSYNKFNNNVYRDALIVPLVNCFTSFFAGFVIFSVIGFMAAEVNLPVSEVITSGPGLAFIAYPEAIARLPGAPIWAVLFFFMLLTIGLDSQFGMFETMSSAFVDEFPEILGKRKILFTASMCTFMMLLGIPYVTRGGVYLFQLTDWYCASFSVMVIAMFSCLVLAWLYGAKRLMSDIEFMIGYRPLGSFWWIFSWRFVTPMIMAAMLICNGMYMKAPTYGTYHYPSWAVGIGWGMAMLSIIPIPIVALYKYITAKGPLKERFLRLIHHTADWGPASRADRARYSFTKYGDKEEMEKFEVTVA